MFPSRELWLHSRSNDGNGKGDLVQSARESVAGGIRDILVAPSAKSSTPIARFGAGWTCTKRALHAVASARSGAATGHDSNGNECAAEKDIENDCKECEETLASKTASQDNGEDGVYNADSALAMTISCRVAINMGRNVDSPSLQLPFAILE